MESTREPTPEEPRIHVVTAVLALGLAASAALPLLHDGTSFLGLVVEALRRNVLHGVVMLFGFGSPFLFGLASALGVLGLPRSVARSVVGITIAFMHSQLLIVAFSVITAPADFAAPVALLGFAVVGALWFTMHRARTRAEGDGPSLAWYVRWGAVLVAGTAGWIRLQRVVGIELGIGLDVALLCAVAMIVSLGLRPLRTAAPLLENG